MRVNVEFLEFVLKVGSASFTVPLKWVKAKVGRQYYWCAWDKGMRHSSAPTWTVGQGEFASWVVLAW